MRKYIFIFKTQIMSNLQYIVDILFGFLGYFIMLFILFNLWKYLYSDPNELINGYSMNQMTWYVIFTEVLWMTIGGRKFCAKISEEVKGGNVTYKINKPYDYVCYCLSKHLGDITLKFLIYSLLGLFTGFLFLGSFPKLSILNILIVILVAILSLIINTLLLTSFGLLAFFFEDANPFYWVYSKFILVLGTIFPIEYFPKVMQKFLCYSPIYVVSYGPAKLFVEFSYENALKVLIAQIIYIIISFSICKFIYGKGVKKINVNGG